MPDEHAFTCADCGSHNWMPRESDLVVRCVNCGGPAATIPNGWAKLDGEWVRLVEIDVVADDGETLTCWAKRPPRAVWAIQERVEDAPSENDQLRDALRDIVNASRDDGLAAMCSWMRDRAYAALTPPSTEKMRLNPEPLKAVPVKTCIDCGMRAPWCKCGSANYR